MMKALAAAIVASAFVLGCGGAKKDAEMPEMEEETVDEDDNPVAEPDETSEESVVPGKANAPTEGINDEPDGDDDPDDEDAGDEDDPE